MLEADSRMAGSSKSLAILPAVRPVCCMGLESHLHDQLVTQHHPVNRRPQAESLSAGHWYLEPCCH